MSRILRHLSGVLFLATAFLLSPNAGEAQPSCGSVGAQVGFDSWGESGSQAQCENDVTELCEDYADGDPTCNSACRSTGWQSCAYCYEHPSDELCS
jgi:hypothetical protein